MLIGGMPQSFSYSVTVFDPNVLPGDYNSDHYVNAADYVVWRDSLGKTGVNLTADGNGDAGPLGLLIQLAILRQEAISVHHLADRDPQQARTKFR